MSRQYFVEDGFTSLAFDSAREANATFLSLARARIESFARRGDDWGYFDVQLWISVRDASTRSAIEYWMPSLSGGVEALLSATPEDLQSRVEFVRIKADRNKRT